MMIFTATNTAAVISRNELEFSSALVNHVKRWAKKQNPRFRPFKPDDGEDKPEWFILLVGSDELDQFKSDPDIASANPAGVRDRDEYLRGPFFRDGDLFYNGVVIREIQQVSVGG